MTVIINLYFLIVRLYNKGYEFYKELKNFG
jgi:hypothetical protein